jgi:RNA polymerase sigma-70 factor, ECF subfamily
MSDKRKEFSKIYDKYIGKIYRFVFIKVNTQEIAQDLCSEAFIKCWEVFKQEGVDNIQALLYKITRNLIIDHYREKGRTQFVQIDDLPIIDPRLNLEKKAGQNLELEQVKNGLADLRDDYQNVIIWHYLDDLPISDVAKLMDRSEDATRVLLHRALESLKMNVKPEVNQV